MNYFAIGHLGASGGIQVTASHNPAKYNGLKLSRRDAIPVSSDTGIGTLETLVGERPAHPGAASGTDRAPRDRGGVPRARASVRAACGSRA